MWTHHKLALLLFREQLGPVSSVSVSVSISVAFSSNDQQQQLKVDECLMLNVWYFGTLHEVT